MNGDLTVTGAKDVKVTKLKGDDAAEEAIVAINGKAEITCSGDVILKVLAVRMVTAETDREWPYRASGKYGHDRRRHWRRNDY